MAIEGATYETREGTYSDSAFLANAILHAERAHTGRGIWDAYYCEQVSDTNESSDNDDNVTTAVALKCLQHCVEHANNSIYSFERFVVMCESDDGRGTSGQPVACASGFMYPEVNMGTVLSGLRVANEELLHWTNEQSDLAEARLSFLSEAFPDVEFADKWMIEGVFTSPACRGRGLGVEVLKRVLQRGRALHGCSEAYIVCADGNEAAMKMYRKAGFQVLAKCGGSEACVQHIRTRGFHVLHYVY